jgi:hypothetical protein
LRPLLESQSGNWPDRSIVVDSQRLENIVRWRQAAVMTEQWRLVNPSADGDRSKLELYDIRQDPGQQRNLAAQNPKIVDRLNRDYDIWWKETSQRANESVRIVLGNPAADPVTLTSHDWHGGDGADKTWNQHLIRQGPEANGYWTVDVEKAGRYRIELRRWPKELDLPINAPYHDATPNRESAKGAAVSAVKARLKIGDFEKTMPVESGDKGAVFTAQLERGTAELQTWLFSQDGTERGAYYVYVELSK